jgi:hypothetical protein
MSLNILTNKFFNALSKNIAEGRPWKIHFTILLLNTFPTQQLATANLNKCNGQLQDIWLSYSHA